MIRPFSDVDLHAYVDGQVSPERRTAIEAYLATAPTDAARVAQWRRQTETVQALFAAAAREPVPLWLTVGQIASGRATPVPLPKPASRRAPDKSRPGRLTARPLRPALAAALAFAAGAGAAVAVLHTPPRLAVRPATAAPPPIADRARAAQAVFGADTGASIYRADVTPAEAEAWLRGRLPFALKIPDLTEQRWTFAGARLIADPAAPAVLLLYSDAAGERLSLYASASTERTDTDVRASFDGGGSLTWTTAGVAYAALTSRTPSWLIQHGAWLQDATEGTPSPSP